MRFAGSREAGRRCVPGLSGAGVMLAAFAACARRTTARARPARTRTRQTDAADAADGANGAQGAWGARGDAVGGDADAGPVSTCFSPHQAAHQAAYQAAYQAAHQAAHHASCHAPYHAREGGKRKHCRASGYPGAICWVPWRLPRKPDPRLCSRQTIFHLADPRRPAPRSSDMSVETQSSPRGKG